MLTSTGGLGTRALATYRLRRQVKPSKIMVTLTTTTVKPTHHTRSSH